MIKLAFVTPIPCYMRQYALLATFAVILISLLSGCGQKKAQQQLPQISIFCDHIESVARQNGISFSEAAAKIKEIGFAGADVRVFQKPEEIRILDSLGFGHSCAITDIDYSKGDQTELEDKTLAFMEENGYDRLLLVTGLMPKEGFSSQDIATARQRIAAFASRVKGRGYTIMVEDYDSPRSLCYNAERLDSLFAVAKDLGLVFDSGNFQFAGEDSMEQLEHFLGRVGHVHLKDRASVNDMTCVPIGTGCIPVGSVIRTLVKNGYSGWLTVEQFGSRNMLEDCAVSFRNISKAIEMSNPDNVGPKALVLYYSQSSTTKAVAREISNRLCADIEAIVPVVPYDGDFQATVERGRKEREEGVLPEIQPLKSDIKSYDIIFLGYPIWFGTYAPPIATLLNSQDFSGKKVVPFCSFGSGGLDSSTKDLKDKLPNVEILPGYGVRAARVDAIPCEIDRFLKENGFIDGEITKLEDFPAAHPVSDEESALFDAAVGNYPMIQAKASEVASRPVPGGTEYLFTAASTPNPIKVYVLVEDGKDPVFTQVLR